MKKIFLIILTMVIAMNIFSIVALAEAEPDVFVNGKCMTTNAKIVNGRTMAPLRAVFEMLGYNVQYDSNTHTAIAGVQPQKLPNKRDDGVINIVVNNRSITSDVNPFVENGVTYVPIRFIAEAANLNVEWDENANAVYVGVPQTSIYTAKVVAPHVISEDKYGNKRYSIPYNIIPVGNSDILYVHDNGGISSYDTAKNNTYNADIVSDFSDKKITTVDGKSYWGFNVADSFFDYNTGSVSLYGRTYYKNPYGLLVLYTDNGNKIYTYPNNYNPFDLIPYRQVYDVISSLQTGGYLWRNQYDTGELMVVNGDTVTIHEPLYFEDMVTFTEHKGNLYYFTCDNTLSYIKKYIYTLYKYNFDDKTTTEVCTFDPIKHQLMFSNGKIFEETETGFNVYSLSGRHLRSIVIENLSELFINLAIYPPDGQYDVENDSGIHESLNGNIYCIAKDGHFRLKQLVQLTPSVDLSDSIVNTSSDYDTINKNKNDNSQDNRNNSSDDKNNNQYDTLPSKLSGQISQINSTYDFIHIRYAYKDLLVVLANSAKILDENDGRLRGITDLKVGMNVTVAGTTVANGIYEATSMLIH